MLFWTYLLLLARWTWSTLHLAKVFFWKFWKLSALNQRLFPHCNDGIRRQQNAYGNEWSFPFRLDETEKVEYSEGCPFVPGNFRLICAICISIGWHIGIFFGKHPNNLRLLFSSSNFYASLPPWTDSNESDVIQHLVAMFLINKLSITYKYSFLATCKLRKPAISFGIFKPLHWLMPSFSHWLNSTSICTRGCKYSKVRANARILLFAKMSGT